MFEAVALLYDLLSTENAALKKHDVAKVRELADRKDALTRLYADQMKAITANRACLEILAPEQREALKALGLKLDAAVAANGRLLTANIEASRRMMQVIVEAVRDDRANISSYSSAGKKADEPDKGHETALTFDQDI